MGYEESYRNKGAAQTYADRTGRETKLTQITMTNQNANHIKNKLQYALL